MSDEAIPVIYLVNESEFEYLGNGQIRILLADIERNKPEAIYIVSDIIPEMLLRKCYAERVECFNPYYEIRLELRSLGIAAPAKA